MGQCACMEGVGKGNSAGGRAPTPEKAVSKRKRGSQFEHASFVPTNKGKLDKFYQTTKKLGEGAYGTVWDAKNLATGHIRAVKEIKKTGQKKSALDKLYKEIEIMKILDHPNIIKLYESFDDDKNNKIFLVMELCQGGEMFDRIIDAGHFSEPQAATVMQQIVRGIFYMHGKHVCHRDLKPENFIFQEPVEPGKPYPVDKSNLKIIDFGLSCVFDDGQVLTSKAGTPYYVAPQVLSGKYDMSCDVWSCGVIMYVLLCGYPPFYGETDKEILTKVRSAQFSFPASDWSGMSEDSKTLIKQMLQLNPRQRFTAEQALNHAWIKDKAAKASGATLAPNRLANMKSFRAHNRLKKAALHIIANQMDESEIKELRRMFTSLDANGDGRLTTNEMREGIAKAGLKEIPADLQQTIDGLDSDGSGEIDYTEFLAACLDQRFYVKEDVCRQAFRVFDKDGDGHITTEELKAVLGDDEVEGVVGAATIQALMGQVDKDGDGTIDFSEFMEMMNNAGSNDAA